MSETADLLAVDVGTSRVKFGWFPAEIACLNDPVTSTLPIASPQLPLPDETFACRHRDVPPDELAEQIAEWLTQLEVQQTQVALSSVSPEATKSVAEILAQHGFSSVKVLTSGDLSLEVQVIEPNRVGIDRLLSAVAVNRVRNADRSAIVMDLGTAVTVDLISHHGVFLGGAILPGWSLAAAALHGGTSSLPLLSSDNIQLPEHDLGKCTTEAIAAGLTWGLIGALEKLIEKYTELSEGTPQLFLTGGDAPMVLDALSESTGPVRHISHLILAGIAIVSEAKR
ncbi:type III pantothenate kinase [Bythopirellula goksoeyrii]|uniref:Type III pantothenate kinase n=1 Tax=Bythopirellula goksoeyrii TaxID=1400387 RepID=A0A5B9QKJ8_9BACT|nr:type III pantothenate kinase [Bythopirellula goksoeyrii]QEG37566.1 Type III pantothenate kinase [Bythopirellula goksoeyrii]